MLYFLSPIAFHRLLFTAQSFRTLQYFSLFYVLSCGSSPSIEKLHTEYQENPSGTATVRVVVDYDRNTYAYTKSTYDYANPPNVLSTVKKALSSAQASSFGALLDSLSVRSYKTDYNDPPPASGIDSSFVSSTFFCGTKKFLVNMDTSIQSTVPKELIRFCDSIRNHEFFN